MENSSPLSPLEGECAENRHLISARLFGLDSPALGDNDLSG